MRVENTSGRQYDLSANGVTVSIPRGQGGDDGKQNGVADVPDELLTALANDVVVKAWFDSGDLVKRSGVKSPAPAAGSAVADHTDDHPSRRVTK